MLRFMQHHQVNAWAVDPYSGNAFTSGGLACIGGHSLDCFDLDSLQTFFLTLILTFRCNHAQENRIKFSVGSVDHGQRFPPFVSEILWVTFSICLRDQRVHYENRRYTGEVGRKVEPPVTNLQVLSFDLLTHNSLNESTNNNTVNFKPRWGNYITLSPSNEGRVPSPTLTKNDQVSRQTSLTQLGALLERISLPPVSWMLTGSADFFILSSFLAIRP